MRANGCVVGASAPACTPRTLLLGSLTPAIIGLCPLPHGGRGLLNPEARPSFYRLQTMNCSKPLMLFMGYSKIACLAPKVALYRRIRPPSGTLGRPLSAEQHSTVGIVVRHLPPLKSHPMPRMLNVTRRNPSRGTN
jgi:hypothetical protein